MQVISEPSTSTYVPTPVPSRPSYPQHGKTPKLKVRRWTPPQLSQIPFPPTTSFQPTSISPDFHKIIGDNKPVRIAKDFVRTTHVIPAVSSRTVSKGEEEPTPDAPVEVRKAWFKRAGKRVVNTMMAIENGEIPESTDVQLFNCVDRYSRVTPRKGRGITLIVHHNLASGRRIWGPLIRHLVRIMDETMDGAVIDEIWAFEAAPNGDSAMLNKGKLGDTFQFEDGSRDVLNFLLHYLPSHAEPTPLPTILNPVSSSETLQRRSPHTGFRHRSIYGIGQCMGGTVLARTAIDFPQLYSGIMLLEPSIFPDLGLQSTVPGLTWLMSAGYKCQQEWESREALRKWCLEAETLFHFDQWDPEVLEQHIDEAVYETEKGTVQLKMTPFVEMVSFFARSGISATWELLPQIDERVALHWVVAGSPFEGWANIACGEYTKDEIMQATVWRRPQNASNVIMPCGHKILHETPRELAHEIRRFLVDQQRRSALSRRAVAKL